MSTDFDAIPHIALIDSGIGGFSVLEAIERRLGALNVSYYMDNLYLPYGELGQQPLLQRLESITDFLQKVEPDLIVIACNTASTQSLCFLREQFNQTFVGVVPAIKPAAQSSRNGHIGLLATPATAHGDYLGQLIESFAAHCQVQRVGSCELVHMAEQWFWQGELPEQALCFPELDSVDTLVLGCTHFPMIKDYIRSLFADDVNLIDSGEAIANRVHSLLPVIGQSSDTTFKQLYCSAELDDARQARLRAYGFDEISVEPLVELPVSA